MAHWEVFLRRAMRKDYHQWRIEMVNKLAERSTCTRRKVGCILVDEKGKILAEGFNGVPSGWEHCNETARCPGAQSPWDRDWETTNDK